MPECGSCNAPTRWDEAREQWICTNPACGTEWDDRDGPGYVAPD